MSTTIISRADEPEAGLACGIGRTAAVAKERAIAMYIEREMRIAHTDKEATANAQDDVEADIADGALLLVTFG